MENKKSITDFSFIGIGRIFTVGLQAIFYILLASFIDPETFGELHVILALAGTFSIISLLGLNLSLQVFQAKKNSGVTSQIITVFLISTSAAGIILLFIEPLAAFLCVALSMFTMNRANLLGLKQYKKHMIVNIIKATSFFIIPIILYFSFDISGIIVGMTISNFIGGIPFYRNLTLQSFFQLRKHFKTLVHNFGASAGGQLSMVIDKLAIAPLFGLFVVGIYQFNLQVFLALSILPGILGTYLITEESSGVGHRKLSKVVVICSIILPVIAIILAPILVPVFFPKYVEGIIALQVLVITIIPESINAIYGAKLVANESTKIGFTAIVKISSLLLLIAILGEIFGLVGLSLAVLISTSAATALNFVFYKIEK